MHLQAVRALEVTVTEDVLRVEEFEGKGRADCVATCIHNSVSHREPFSLSFIFGPSASGVSKLDLFEGSFFLWANLAQVHDKICPWIYRITAQFPIEVPAVLRQIFEGSWYSHYPHHQPCRRSLVLPTSSKQTRKRKRSCWNSWKQPVRRYAERRTK